MLNTSIKFFNLFSDQPDEAVEDSQQVSAPQRSSDDPLPIAKDTNLGELAAEYPHLAQLLAEDYGLHCVGCFASSFDTLEMGAAVHGMTEEEIEEMVERLKAKHKKHLKKVALTSSDASLI